AWSPSSAPTLESAGFSTPETTPTQFQPIPRRHPVEVRRLTISTAAVDAGMIRIDVADTGPGMSEASRARLFEPFKTTKAHGLGVGLALSRSIIEAHYGTIWAEPNHGGGTVLRFTLPLAE
ncbi:hypothetical protein C5689_16230, partial [Methylosinus sporium]